MRVTAIITLMAAAILATACSGKPAPMSYTSPSTGKTTVIESDREMCDRACNDDYTRCMESSAAGQTGVGPGMAGVPETTPGMAPGLIGPSADCRHDLQNCLPDCKSR